MVFLDMSLVSGLVTPQSMQIYYCQILQILHTNMNRLSGKLNDVTILGHDCPFPVWPHKFRTNCMPCDGRCLNSMDLPPPDFPLFRQCKRAPKGDEFMSGNNVQDCGALVYAAL